MSGTTIKGARLSLYIYQKEHFALTGKVRIDIDGRYIALGTLNLSPSEARALANAILERIGEDK